MIRILFVAFGFLIGSVVELRVEAAERVQLAEIHLQQEQSNPLSSALLEEPADCLASTEKCAIRIGKGRRFSYLPTPKRDWTFSEKTIVVRLAKDRLKFIEGSMRIKGSMTTVEVEQGTVVIVGEAFIETQGRSLIVVNTGATTASFTARGTNEAKEAVDIPLGLEAAIGPPDIKNGSAAVTLPLPFDFDKQVVREARLFSGGKQEFDQRLEHLAETRFEAAQLAAELHRAVVERKLASLDAKEQKRKQDLAKRELRDRELRALFRRKVLNPE